MISEAAYHEAGHAVAAELSDFHSIGSGQTTLTSYGAGAADIARSRTKLINAGVPADQDASSLPSVARSLAITLVAGFVAERIAAKTDTRLQPSETAAHEDYVLLETCTDAAGLSTERAEFEAEAEQLLRANWNAVFETARMLERVRIVENHELQDWVRGGIT